MDKKIIEEKVGATNGSPRMSERYSISAIIPAFDEEKNIRNVINTLEDYALLKEIIVVDDGSRDATSNMVRKTGARLITLPKNLGKGRAMDVGVKASTGKFIFFLDADITGLNTEVIDRIVSPVVRGEFDMFVGIRARKAYFLNKMLRLFPVLGGERILAKEIWDHLPSEYKRGFQIEIALNYFTKRMGKKMGFEIIRGLSQTIKEKKYGFIVGFGRRLVMVYDVVLIGIKLYVVHRIRKRLGLVHK